MYFFLLFLAADERNQIAKQDIKVVLLHLIVVNQIDAKFHSSII